ncbi:MAG: flagellar basal body-associated FliL family protein [Pseudobdellovibrio sp.]
MHVNVKPSENSGNNPMLALEVTAEGLSTDAIVEIKDREAEFKDMLLRLTEDKTYDELSEAEGKQNLCEQFRDLLNANLTRGQVRRVLLKSFIIKP